tara:strand:+ start:2937 stop:3770 length:834 start_codon:yes stop_codon:yes gene_type:complete
MADKKISALDTATTPLAGTEVLPIVQGGATKKVSVDNLTAGKVVSASSFNKVAITAPANSSTLTIADGKTLTANNSIALSGTDATTMTFPATNATIARTDAAQSFTGDQTLSTGNLVIGTVGKGIDFSATGDSSGTMTSELFSDYEEGTFTPVVADAATGGNTATPSYSAGKYTKIGRIVTIQIRLDNLNTTGMTAGSPVFIRGLPFAAANDTISLPAPIEMSRITYAGFVNASIEANASYITLRETNNNAVTTNVVVSDLTSTEADIRISAIYNAA